jgi:outer membrane immunogenic protein
MFKRKRYFVTLMLSLALVPLGAVQAAESGFYLGGSIGQASFDVPTDITEIPSFNEDDTGYKVFGGYNFNIGIINLGVEGGYVDFGNPSARFNTAVLSIDADGWNVWGIGGVNLGPFDVFAKVGVVSWDASISVTGLDPGLGSLSDSGSDPGYGLGARISFGRLAVRGEWEVYEIEDTDDVSMFSVGLAWRF